MESDWPLLAAIGGALASAGSAVAAGASGLGTAAAGAAQGLGGLASTAGTAATGALEHLGVGSAAAPAAAGASGAAGAGAGVVPAAEVASAGPAAASASPPLLAAQGPALPTVSDLSSVPGVTPAQYPTPTTYALQSPAQSGITPGGPSLLDQLTAGAKNAAFERFGVTNPNMGWGDIAKQASLSQIAGSPFYGYNPQAPFLSNLAHATTQRVLSQLFPDQTQGQQPQTLQQVIQRMLAMQGQPARQLPVYSTLPGYG